MLQDTGHESIANWYSNPIEFLDAIVSMQQIEVASSGDIVISTDYLKALVTRTVVGSREDIKAAVSGILDPDEIPNIVECSFDIRLFKLLALMRGSKIKVKGKEIPTGALSSYTKAQKIAEELKSWIKDGKFTLSEYVSPLPSAESGYTFKSLKERPVE